MLPIIYRALEPAMSDEAAAGSSIAQVPDRLTLAIADMSRPQPRAPCRSNAGGSTDPFRRRALILGWYRRR